ncbi:ATP-binding protein [Blastomonas sp. AAP53]|uniref:GAF domain-containing hybrid sensor histidine kinase/response regulator n=1 Tax=Blastomonas sp. AAP53 TaxID=1248760 RepID=UPI0002D86D13|nr:ATP-binding protein [Blastomonas sp. AAP53]
MLLNLGHTNFRSDDEPARLAALRAYQLCPDETDNGLYADLVALARAIGDCETAFISIVEEERQWFKASEGLDLNHSPRSIAFCDHAVRTSEVMVVLDAAQDPRFADNPLVTGPPHIRFYAGAPIINGEGYALGTICLSDSQPRTHFDGASMLAALARQVAALLELRKQLIHQQLAANLAADQRDRLWDSSLDMMLITTTDGVLVAGNPAWEKAFGPVPADSTTHISAFFADPQDGAQVQLASGQSDVQVEREMRGRDGQPIFASWSLAREGDLIFGIARDITRARAAEAQLAQVQRMETIGQLTGGIAHDFNNLLTIISGNLDIAQKRIASGQIDRADAAIANARDGAGRAANLTQRLLAYARRQSLTPTRIKPADLIRDLEPLAAQALDERHTLNVECPDSLWPITVDASQLENALLNLVVNARDAMDQPGTITIQATNAHRDAEDLADGYDAPPGRYVRFCVDDTGSGIAPHVAEHIFEPFFTTKDIGKGTGLGLSQVQGFVVQSGGFVTLKTAPGEGTTLSLWLPVTEDAADASAQGVLRGDGEDTCRAGCTIMLAEDNAALRAHVCDVLQEAGFKVVEAEDGQQALDMMRAAEPRPDLLLSDITMPRMDGRALAAEVHRAWPEIPIVLMTGYAGGALESGCPHDLLITKPFAPDDLVALVRRMLSAVPAA